MTLQDDQYEITSGPDPLDLAMSMLKCYPAENRCTSTFEVRFDDEASSVEVRIAEMGHEDDSGCCWTLRGYLMDPIFVYKAGQAFTVSYNSISLTGTITFKAR